jgi:hypothetical protein
VVVAADAPPLPRPPPPSRSPCWNERWPAWWPLLKGWYRASLRSNFVKVRENGRVVSQAIVIAIAVTANGEREVLGLDVGPSESTMMPAIAR